MAPTKLILWEHPILDVTSDRSSLYAQLVAADCIARAPLEQHQRKYGEQVLGSGVPIPRQFSDLTLPKCQKIWKDYQISHAIATGAEGFKLDEDDVDVSVGFNDSTVFPSGMRGYQFHNRKSYCTSWPTLPLFLQVFCEETGPGPHS